MSDGVRRLHVVGDRVLIRPDDKEQRTKVGLVLPPGVADKDDVRGGTVLAKGPGMPLPPPQDEYEPWKDAATAPRYLPMQIDVGDYALFFRKAAVEIRYEGERYLVVPYQAILVLVRGADVPDQLPEEL